MLVERYFSKVNENDIPARKKLFQNKPGIYILRSGCEDSPTPVSRICGEDKDGILYIGISSPLTGGRVSELKKSLAPKQATKGHLAGVRYQANDILKTKYPYETLYLELIVADTSKDAGIMEGKRLAAYVDKYGELPPFNRSG
ncbi:hypothetical protein HWV00_05880 [Moritella sp. 24]|uniref:hypothetical protein n=1 Tax=Moritella sp. 24 TaxID=2746230 RepID=UPI001BA57C94|nr:hypothetical protein [Moritella sp. 24]QUM75797.1 hypothetical protein HWV00_05880 [Moritella sp. 24]